MQNINSTERLWVKEALLSKKGLRLSGTPFKYGQAVEYNGQRWLVYDHEAVGGGSALVLVTPDLKSLIRGVPLNLSRTARFEEGKSVDVPEYLRDAGNPEAAEQWEKMNELHGDRFKTARMKLIARVARFEEGENVDVPEYLRDAGNPEAAKEWENNTEEYGDKESVRTGNGSMLYNIDAVKNHSKFHEMLIVPQGSQFLLKRRWGALTDQNGGLVKMKDEVFPNEQAAKQALATIKLEKTRKGGYIDAFGPKHEMNGRKLPMGEYPVGLDRQVGFGWGTQSVVKVLPQLKGVLTQVQQAYQQMERGSSLEMISTSIQSAERALKALERNDEGSMIAKLLEQIAPVSRMIQEADPDMQNDVKLTLALNRFINYLTKQLSVAHA